jgi:hypothetical protein
MVVSIKCFFKSNQLIDRNAVLANMDGDYDRAIRAGQIVVSIKMFFQISTTVKNRWPVYSHTF